MAFKKLIKMLAKNEITNKLMSYSQLFDFGLGRYIGDYGDRKRNDLPRARALGNGIIEVRSIEEFRIPDKLSGECHGRGTAAKAMALLLKYIPDDIGYAEYQSLEQFEARISE